MKTLYLFIIISLFYHVCFSQQAFSLKKNIGPNPGINSPLYGDYYETYFYTTFISVGTPPRDMEVIVDTGSSDLWLFDARCDDSCNFVEKSKCYNDAKSSTSKRIPCTGNTHNYTCSHCVDGQCSYDIAYVGTDFDAVLYNDIIVLSEILAAQVDFGGLIHVNQLTNHPKFGHIFAQRSHAGFSFPQGLWGLAYQSLSASNSVPMFYDFTLDLVFSMCLTDHGGMMTLGGIGHYFADPPMWTPIIQDNFYTIYTLDVLVNDKSIGVSPLVYNKEYSIVDSGTPFPALPQEAYTALQNTFFNNCTHNNLTGVCKDLNPNGTLFDGICYQISDEEIARFPTITFVHKNNTDLTYPPSAYLRQTYNCNEGEVGLLLQVDTFTVMGASILQRYTTIYDIGNSKMGFSLSQGCPSHS